MSDTTRSISVLVADDHPDLAMLLAITINHAPDMKCVGTLASADSLLAEVESKQPDIVLLDLCMPGSPPLESMNEVVVKRPSPRFLVLSGDDDPETQTRALRAGARAFLIKGAVLSTVLDAIRQVHRGAALS